MKKKSKIIAIACTVLVVVVTLAAVLPIYAFPPTVTLDYGYATKISVNYSGSGQEIIKTEKVYRNHTYNPPIIKRDGYTFKGWYKDTALITPWLSTDKVKSDITLYAKWEATE